MNSSYYVDTVDTSYGVSQTAGLFGAIFGLGAFIWIVFMVIGILQIIAMWKIFVKAGKPGWASIIPIYNTYVMCQIAEKEWWYILLMCIPLVNIFAMFVVYDGIAKKFGKSTGFTIGMILVPFVFFMILGFDKNSVYLDGYSVASDSNELESTQAVSNVVDTAFDNVTEPTIQNSPSDEGYVAPSFDFPGVGQQVEQSSPAMEPTPIMSEPVAPVMEPAPIMNEPVAPVMEPTPIMSEPVAPVMDPAPMMSEPVAPMMETTPIMSEPVAPMMETTPMMSEQVAPVVEPTPMMNELVAPVIEESTVEPQVQQEVQMPSEQPHTSLWSNNNTNNGQM